MSSAIHQPSNIQYESPTEHSGYKPGILQCLAPTVNGNNRWQDETCDWHQYRIVTEKISNKLCYYDSIASKLCLAQ